tara:strand:+ start:1820 stop:2587 length:768 start_codon:yes stop_codon:yes gene_type:complete
MNKLFFHPQCVLYVGQSFDTILHHHHSVQIIIGIEALIQVNNEHNNQLISKAIIIPANYSHKLIINNTAIVTIFIDAQSAFYQQLRLSCKHITFNCFQEVSLCESTLKSLSDLATEDLKCDYVGQLIEKVINELTIKGICQTPLDERIKQVLLQLDNHQDSQLPIDDLASSVHLSTSRLAHLFKAQVGIPIRRYSLWRRIRYAIEYANDKGSLTEGAYYAGFSDSAHLSRVFKEMFGFNPSSIISKKVPLRLFFL